MPKSKSAQQPETLPPHLFRLAVDQAALAISITDERANILYANAAFARTTGYTQEEIVGHNESILSYRVTPKIVYETLWAQIQRQRPWNGLLVNKRKNGDRYIADVTITPVLNDQGKTTHYLGMHRDVTEVNLLERQVQNQKTLIESVVDAAQIAIALLDEKERVVLDNQEYKKLVASIGKEPALQFLAALRKQIGEEAFTRMRTRRDNIAPREISIEAASHATRWFSCSISWFEEHDIGADAFYEPVRHHYLLLTAQDISELKHQQEALRINGLRAMLAEQERLQGMRETLAGAIYRLEGPFNVLSAVTNLLERRLSSQVDGEVIPVSAMADALRNSRDALETLRASIPAQPNEAMRQINLNEVLSDVLKLATADLLAAGIVVEWEPCHESPVILGHTTQIANLFKQLIANAIEAINEKRNGKRDLRLVCRKHDDHVAIDVEDSGPGIPEELRYKIFQPFFTTKGATKRHLGIGLAMAQEAVNHHGGTMDIDSNYYPGCRVRVQLPSVQGGKHA